MRHLQILIVLSLAACGPVASSTDDTDAGPADAPTAAADAPTAAADVPAAGEADASGAWRGGLCLAVSGDPDPWCIAAQSRDAGPDGAWCHLRDLRDGDTGLTPWRECLAYAVAGMPADLRPRWDAIVASGCDHPPPRCGVGASRGACNGLRVYAGRTVQMYLARATALGQCWPRTP